MLNLWKKKSQFYIATPLDLRSQKWDCVSFSACLALVRLSCPRSSCVSGHYTFFASLHSADVVTRS